MGYIFSIIKKRSQYGNNDWRDLLKTYGLVARTSRPGNCDDNGVTESFFQLPKRERIRRKIYLDREEARRDVFNDVTVM